MAMSGLPGILKERKFPFIIALFLLLVLVAFLIVSDSPPPFPIATNLSLLSHDVSLQRPSIPPDSINLYTTAMTVTIPLVSSDSNDTAIPTNPSIVNATSESTTPHAPQSDLPSSSGISFNNESVVVHTSDDRNVVVAAATAALDVKWKLCKGPAAVDYIPCLDNWEAIKSLKSRKRMEHRERYCPNPNPNPNPPRCLVPLPRGYKSPVPWTKSRDMVRSLIL